MKSLIAIGRPALHCAEKKARSVLIDPVPLAAGVRIAPGTQQ